MATPTGTVFTVTDLSGATYNLHGVLYGECTTAAATQAKVVSIPGIASLTEGLSIRVRFQYAQTYNGAPTLNVNSLGAKTIRRSSVANAARYEWSANEILDLVYDGTYWVLIDGGLATTTYYGVTKLATSATSTSTSTALTPGSLNSLVLNMIANYPIFSTSETYEVGDRVRHNYNIWECKKAITTAGAWNENDWTEIPTLLSLIEARYLKPETGIPASDLASGVIPDISGKADKSATVTDVAYNTSNKKITKTINGTTTDIVSVSTLKTDMALGNVENKSSATIRGEITSSNITSALGFTPLNASLKGANNGLAELDSAGKVPSSQLPSYVDDVLEYDSKSAFPSTGESGKIYIAKDTNLTYRWSGSAYTEISASLALGITSSTAFRGDYGNAAYTHAVTNKGSAFASGLYKITTNSEGHVTHATAVQKSDITNLGIPGSDTNTHRPIQVNGTEILGDNTTALNLKAGSSISLTNSSGTITIAATDTTYSFDGTYNASTNKAATVSTVTNSINALDGNISGVIGSGKTLTSFSQTNGKVTAVFNDISITKSQISDFPQLGAAALKGVTDYTTRTDFLTTDQNLVTARSIANAGYTRNTGTITGIKMNGDLIGSSGIVDLGTVIISHQDISGKADKSSTVSAVSYNTTSKKITETINGLTTDVVSVATLKIDMELENVENKNSREIRSEITSENVTTALGFTPMNANLKGAVNGVAELDTSGKVPTSQLPAILPTVTTSDNGKALRVINGAWAKANAPSTALSYNSTTKALSVTITD